MQRYLPNFKKFFEGLKQAFPYRSRKDDVELDQARVRFIIEVIVFIYLFASFAVAGFDDHELDVVIHMGGLVFIAALIYYHIHKHPGHFVFRRLFVIALDNLAVTYFMDGGNKIGGMLFPLFLWITIGNGFRYGRRYLFVSQILSLSGFIYLCQFNPYWRSVENTNIFFAVLIIIPLYATSLIRTLTEAIDKAKEASEAKTRFVSNMSHEIRTPLHGIIGIGELLSLRNYDEEYKNLCDKLSKSAKVLLQLVNDVLDFSKIESGQFEINLKPFDLHKTVKDITTVLFDQIDNQNIRTDINISPDIGRYWVGDAQHIQQVLMNLVGNSIKFTESGNISVTVEKIGTNRQRSVIRFRVKDSGIGMSPEFLAKIFDRFAQADGESQAKHKGTGLGTTIAKQLVEAMGGTVGVESAPNIGTDFWFDLPMQEADKVEESSIESLQLSDWIDNPSLNRKGISVLVAEDHETNRMIISTILDKAGYSYSMANDGEEALDMLLENQYDVALLDMQMPALNGIEVCKAYKMIRHDDNRIKFIMLSANVDQENQQRAKQVGFSDCLPKPLESGKLLALLDSSAQESSNEIEQAPAQSISSQEDRTSIINAKILTELSEIASSKDFLQEVVESFTRESLKNINAIENDLRNKNYVSLKRFAHALRGSSSSVGASSIRDIAISIEGMTHAEIEQTVKDLLPHLRVLHQETVALLTDLADELEMKMFQGEQV